MKLAHDRSVELRSGVMALSAKRSGQFRVAQTRLLQIAIQFGDPLTARIDVRKLGPHALRQIRKLVRVDPMLAGKTPNVEQSRFGGFEPRRVERQRIRRARDLVLGLARFDQRAIQRG